MRINEIIKERRLAKGFTQEQIANYLGVTAPAVNKWEKGTSCPDIVLLPALARLLDTDLNTLLSFQDDLSEKEVALFLNEVSEAAKKDGFEAGYSLAIGKIKEYPTCDLLLGNVAMLLNGLLLFQGNRIDSYEKYEEEIEALFQRVMQSDRIDIREQAQKVLDTISKKRVLDREQLQANLYIAQGELEKAAKLTEEKFLSATTEIHGALMTLMEIALKEKRMEDAEYIADIDKQAAQVFDLWEYNSYGAQFQLYVATKKRAKAVKILLPMLRSLTKKWDINSSPLYRHIQTKEVDKSFGSQLQKALVQSIETDEEMKFLKDSEELQSFIKEAELK